MKAIFIGFGHLSKSDNVFNRSTTDGCEIPTASAISCCVWPGQYSRDSNHDTHRDGTAVQPNHTTPTRVRNGAKDRDKIRRPVRHSEP